MGAWRAQCSLKLHKYFWDLEGGQDGEASPVLCEEVELIRRDAGSGGGCCAALEPACLPLLGSLRMTGAKGCPWGEQRPSKGRHSGISLFLTWLVSPRACKAGLGWMVVLPETHLNNKLL